MNKLSQQMFSLDLRSLALMRVLFSLIILFDLVNRARYITAHYTDQGILPVSAMNNFYSDPWIFSFHAINGSWQFQVILFLFAGLFALFLLVGYKTRLTTILSWILLISLQTRNPLILHGGDVLLRLALFWAIFLPWGSRYSIDSTHNQNKEALENNPSYSLASFAYILQIVFVYWFSALLKASSREWTIDGTAIYYALSIDQFTTSFGYLLLKFPRVMHYLTFAVLQLEIAAPFLFLIPIFSQPLRLIGVLLIILLHIGIGLHIELGLFPWIGIATALALLPPIFWEWIYARLRTRLETGLTIYYDGECGFCKKTVMYLKIFLLLPEINLRSALEDDTILQEMMHENSWVVVDAKKQHHYKFDGVGIIIKASPLTWFLAPLLNLPTIHHIGTRLYEYTARHRKNQCMPDPLQPAPIQKKLSASLRTVLPETAVLMCITMVFVWNVGSLTENYSILPSPLSTIVSLLRLDQKWNTFAPSVLKDDGWYVMPGVLRNGTIADVFKNGRPVSWEKPPHVAALYNSERWRKYFINLSSREFASWGTYYGEYMCRHWNETHNSNEQLISFTMIFMREHTLPNYQYSPPQQITLLKQKCF